MGDFDHHADYLEPDESPGAPDRPITPKPAVDYHPTSLFKVGDRVALDCAEACKCGLRGRETEIKHVFSIDAGEPEEERDYAVLLDGVGYVKASGLRKVLHAPVAGAPAKLEVPPSIEPEPRFKVGDHVRLKTESRHLRYDDSEPEVMRIVRIYGDVADMSHDIQPGMPAPWGLEHLVHVETNATCTRCGYGAYQGLFSASCNRPGGCKTIEERIGEPVDGQDIVVVRGRHSSPKRHMVGWNNETAFRVTGRDGLFAIRGLAIDEWRSMRRRELATEDFATALREGIKAGIARLVAKGPR